MRQMPIIQPDQQLVVDVQTPGVEVCGTDIHHAVGNDQLSVENLRLILLDMNPGLQEALIEGAPGVTGQGDIGFPGGDDLHIRALPGRLDQDFTEPAGGQEIGGNNPDDPGPPEIFL